MRQVIQASLAKKLEPKLVSELLDAHAEAKRNYYLGGLRLSEVEGGRFCEAAFRLLECVSFGTCTALSTPLDTEKLIDRLRSLPGTAQPDAVRLHIPRALRLVYDIRNKRDAAHLADGIDPNLQDATLVVSAIDWVLAELVRLYHTNSANEAKAIVDVIVTRVAPVVQDFDGHLKILKPGLGASDHILILLYQSGEKGAALPELKAWVRPQMRANINRTLEGLVHTRDFAHFTGAKYIITRLGQKEVEDRRLVDP